MNRILCTIVCMFALLVSGITFAQGARSAPGIKDKNVDILITYQPTPGFAVDGYKVKSEKSGTSNWLEIECSFYTEKGAEPLFDELTVKYEVLMTAGKNTKGENARVIFSGEETYAMVKRDDMKHRVIAFVSPTYINNYKSDTLKGKKAEDDFCVLVTVSHKGAPIGMGAFVPRSEQRNIGKDKKTMKADLFKMMKTLSDSPASVKLPGSVSRRGTPFEFINFDSYEFLKPAGAPASMAN